MSLITRKGVYWRAVALVFALGVTLTLGVVSSGAHATAKRGATKSIASGSLRTAPPAARALLKRVAAGSAVNVSPRDSRLDSGRTLKRSAANSVTAYTDPAGDCRSTAATTVAVSTCDIRSVNVSNDNNGLITFKVGIPGSPTLTPDMEIAVVIDSDQNPATGDSNGSDYVLDYWTNAGDSTKPIYVALWKLTSAGATYVSPAPDSLSASYTSGVAKFTIGTADLGITGGLGFHVLAYSGLTYDTSGNPTNYTTAPFDRAPNTGSWSYKVGIPLSTARLLGKFNIVEEKKLHDTWTFKPRCSTGACAVKAAIKGWASFKLSRKSATYKGSFRSKVRCTSSRSVTATVSVRFTIKKAAWVGTTWRATSLAGTLRMRAVSCSSGKVTTVALPIKGTLK